MEKIGMKLLKVFLFIYFITRMESSSESSEYSDAIVDDMSNSDTDSELEDLIDVDPCVAMLHDEITTGSLSRDHIFYKYALNALRFAQTVGNPSKQFSWDPLTVFVGQDF